MPLKCRDDTNKVAHTSMKVVSSKTRRRDSPEERPKARPIPHGLNDAQVSKRKTGTIIINETRIEQMINLERSGHKDYSSPQTCASLPPKRT